MDRPKIALDANTKNVASETTSPTSKLTHCLLTKYAFKFNEWDFITFTVDQLRSQGNVLTENDATEQIAPNENILQLVAQIPNHPLQKFAQKLLVDRPKALSESHSKNASDDTTPPKTNSPTTSTS